MIQLGPDSTPPAIPAFRSVERASGHSSFTRLGLVSAAFAVPWSRFTETWYHPQNVKLNANSG